MPTQIYPNAFSGATSAVEVNGALVPGTPNFNGTLPAAPTGWSNGAWQSDGSGNISVALYVSTNASVTVNSTPYSDDFDFFVNHVDQDFLVNSAVPQNASALYTNGSPVIT